MKVKQQFANKRLQRDERHSTSVRSLDALSSATSISRRHFNAAMIITSPCIRKSHVRDQLRYAGKPTLPTGSVIARAKFHVADASATYPLSKLTEIPPTTHRLIAINSISAQISQLD